MQAAAASSTVPASSKRQVLVSRITELVIETHTGGASAPVFELLKLGKTPPRDEHLMNYVFPNLKEAVKKVLGPVVMLVVHTEPCRRQVLFAAIARLWKKHQLGKISLDKNTRLALVSMFLTASNEEIITHTYGRCPPGFLNVITKIGHHACTEDVYSAIFDLVRTNKDVATLLQELAFSNQLTSDTINVMLQLPRTPHTPRS